jgi:cytoskeletal protein CcmA (bactofilin family)
MKHAQDWRIRLVVMAGFLFIGSFGVTRSAQAQGIVRGDGVPVGTTIDGDAFLTGDGIVIDGIVLGDVLAIGRTVTVNGIIDGSLVAIAEKVILSGQVEGSTYIGALTFEVADPATVSRSVYFAGASLFTDPNSRIGRDLSFTTLGSNVTGSVAGDVHATTGLELINRSVILLEDALSAVGINVDLSGIRIGDGPEASSGAIPMITFSGLKIPNGSTQPQPGRYAAPFSGPAGQSRVQEQVEPKKDKQEENVGAWSLERLRQLVQFLIVGGLVFWLMPGRFDNWINRLRTRPGRSTVYGFVGIISGSIGFVLLQALVLAIAIGLAILTLRGLAVTSLLLGMSSTWLLFSIFLIVVLFISKVIVSYAGGVLILDRLFPRANQHRLWPLLLGLVIYILLRSIPFLGWAIGFLVTIIGLGAFLQVIGRSGSRKAKLAGDEEE